MLRGGMQDWPLRVSTIIDHAASVHADREIVTRTGEGPIHRSNYRQVAERARRVASLLRRLGIGFEERVGTMGWNSHRHMEAWYGAAGIGAVYHTINPRLSDDHIAYIIGDAGDRLIFVDPAFIPILERLRDRCVAGRRLIVMTDAAHMPASPLDLHCYEDLIAAEAPDFPWDDVPETTRVGLCYTSGTTGAPKGVVYTHRSTVLHSMATIAPDALNFRSTDSILTVVPMYHANAWSIPFSAPMAGAKLVFPGPGLDGPSLCELIQQEGVNWTAGVPTIFTAMIDQLRTASHRTDTLERVVVGGSACPAWMIEAFQKEFGVEVVHCWGMTEMSPVGSAGTPRPGMETLGPEERLRLRLKQGAPVYGVEMRVVDDSGKALPHDGRSAGKLQVRGMAVVGEYLHGAGGDILDEDGFFDTGDLATIGAFNYMQITDRTKDVIKSGGEWISSIELETHAACHDEVLEAAAIGVVHPKWEERPLLIVVRAPGSTLGEQGVLDFLRPRVAKWWLPDMVHFVDAIPHSATGKIDKVALRKLYGDMPLPG